MIPALFARRAAYFALLGLSAVANIDAAAAHAPPYGTGLLFPDTGDELPLVLTNRGLLFPGPLGYALRCTLAYGASTAEESRGLLADDGRIVVQSSAGVFSSLDQGCTFSRAPGLPPGPLATFATSADRQRLLTSTAGYAEAGQVYVSEDGALGFRALLTLPDKSDVEAMVVAPSRAARVYASGKRLDGNVLRDTWLVSDDGGRSFARTDVPRKRSPIGVHPRNADAVLVAEREVDTSVTTLLRSADGGKTFQHVREVPSVLAFASSADGARSWIGTGVGSDDLRGGLFVSNDDGATFEPIRDELLAVTCLASRGPRLWMCGSVAPGIGGVWSQEDEATPLVAQLRFDHVVTPLDCPGELDSTLGGQCEGDFRDWLTEQVGTAGDAGADAGTPTGPRSHATNGCALHAGQPSPQSAPPRVTAWCSLLGVYALWRAMRGTFVRPRGR
ncbi:MAG: hypothetical protein RL385_3996 [Pseudomonadota bacterium]|jgi:photosystem II stability/assembly factor-like uncharacterized protein